LKGKKTNTVFDRPVTEYSSTLRVCSEAVSASACNAGYRADRTVSLDVHAL